MRRRSPWAKARNVVGPSSVRGQSPNASFRLIAPPNRTRRTRQRRTRKGPRTTAPAPRCGAPGPVGTATGADEPRTAGSLSAVGVGDRERESGTGIANDFGGAASRAAVPPSVPAPGAPRRECRAVAVPTGPRAPDPTRAAGSRCSDPLRQTVTSAGCSSRVPSVTPWRTEFSLAGDDVAHPLTPSSVPLRSGCRPAGSRGLTSVLERPCATALPPRAYGHRPALHFATNRRQFAPFARAGEDPPLSASRRSASNARRIAHGSGHDERGHIRIS